MSAERVVVIGADAAGMSAAHQALRTADTFGRELEIVAIEATGHTSYSACGIPYWIAGDVDSADDLVARRAEQHRAAGIDLRMGVLATGLDTHTRAVTVREADGTTGSVGYDQLVIATGAHPIIPGWARREDGDLHGGVGPVKDLDDGEAWLARFARTFAAAGSSGHVVVAGGGYIGIEMAEAALRRGFGVTVLTRSAVMSSLDPDLSERVAVAMRAAGVRLVEEATVEGVTVGDDGWVRQVTAADGSTYDCDLLVLALGVLPRTGLAAQAGLPTGDRGDLCVDERGLVAPGVWAAGDCCEVLHRLTGDRVFLPLG
ncbi:FAD/NAD(P)-binding oxidoreductase, partial [Nocardioides sp.]|uniref:NAD(P)/FAD-dependent oxidoreductase n=1 Tax=Nocardioides sp. TaxID=35761 RepID=UPI0027342821